MSEEQLSQHQNCCMEKMSPNCLKKCSSSVFGNRMQESTRKISNNKRSRDESPSSPAATAVSNILFYNFNSKTNLFSKKSQLPCLIDGKYAKNTISLVVLNQILKLKTNISGKSRV